MLHNLLRVLQTTPNDNKNYKVPHLKSTDLNRIEVTTLTCCKTQVYPLSTAIGRTFFGQKSPAARARDLFQPSTDSVSLLVDIEKKTFFVFGRGFLEVTSQ